MSSATARDLIAATPVKYNLPLEDTAPSTDLFQTCRQLTTHILPTDRPIDFMTIFGEENGDESITITLYGLYDEGSASSQAQSSGSSQAQNSGGLKVRVRKQTWTTILAPERTDVPNEISLYYGQMATLRG